MAKPKWTRDGDQYVCRLNGHEARITPWNSVLGESFVIAVDGKGKGECGGGDPANALKRAKASAVEYLEKF